MKLTCFCTCQVKKVIKTTTTRTVIPSVSDTLSLDGGSVTGMGGYTTPVGYRQGPGVVVPSTVPRNYHYGPPVGYSDYRAGPPSDAYASLNRSAHMDDRYRWVELHLCSQPPGLGGNRLTVIASRPAGLSTQFTQTVTEPWMQATELTAGTSWTLMRLSHRSAQRSGLD